MHRALRPLDSRSAVKAEKPQIGNPRKLTFWQHVFPARSIERFAGDDGNVAVKHRQSKREFRIPPDDKLFCAQRVWDQRAEAGYMKQIEDEFQTLADEIIAGLNQIGPEKSRIATKFFALWCSRFRQRNEPTPDHFVEGILGENLSKDQEEVLERNWIGYLRTGQMMPGRILSGLQIQMTIQQFEAHFRDTHWGIVVAREGEFVLPDTFGKLAIVPVTPKICLCCGIEGLELSMSEVSKINRQAVQSTQDYCVARDFAMCPS